MVTINGEAPAFGERAVTGIPQINSVAIVILSMCDSHLGVSFKFPTGDTPITVKQKSRSFHNSES